MFNTAGRVSFESGKVGENGLQNHPAMMLRHGLVSFLLHSVLVLGFTYTMFDFGNSIAQGNLKTNLLAKMAATINGPRNACRNLTRLIKRTPGATLRIPIDVCKVTIALRKPKRALQIYWPMIKLAEWCKYLLEFKPQLLLAGHGLGEDWKTTFQNFWSDYRIVCGDHPIFSHPEFDHRTCIPYFIHGDEGRGQLKRPYMVISWQCAIGHGGIQTINDNSHLVRLDLSLSFFHHWSTERKWCPSGCGICSHYWRPVFGIMWWPVFPLHCRHTFTSRWIFSGISSHLYYNDWTIDDLLAELSMQAIDAFENGICESWCDKPMHCLVKLQNM